jgi:DNA (cytosine-5)-methyltransferase 1
VSSPLPAERRLTAGSLCTGYGGLDLALAWTVGAVTQWTAEIEPACARIEAARMPGLLNVGDIAVANWARVPPVDLLHGGFPCQPASSAGQRKGTDDARWLWPFILGAVRGLDPRPWLLVFENVPGLLSVNGGSAFAEVVYGLAELGYVGRYGLYRACDVGAPHRRTRLFVVAADPVRFAAEYPGDDRGLGGAELEAGPAVRGAAGDRGAEAGRGPVAALLPTPQAHDIRGAKSAAQIGAQKARARAAGRGTPGVRNLNETVANELVLLPTPHGFAFSEKNGPDYRNLHVRWGKYEPAVRRWEAMFGPAPCPVEASGRKIRLAAPFAEWMMGLPAGWVTGVRGVSRREQLHAIGNGVVPQQAAAAVADLVTDLWCRLSAGVYRQDGKPEEG